MSRARRARYAPAHGASRAPSARRIYPPRPECLPCCAQADALNLIRRNTIFGMTSSRGLGDRRDEAMKRAHQRGAKVAPRPRSCGRGASCDLVRAQDAQGAYASVCVSVVGWARAALHSCVPPSWAASAVPQPPFVAMYRYVPWSRNVWCLPGCLACGVCAVSTPSPARCCARLAPYRGRLRRVVRPSERFF